MTIEPTVPCAVYTIATAGPFALRDSSGNPWPYTAGGVAVAVVKAGTLTNLVQNADFTLSPASGVDGNLTLSTTALAAHIGGQLIITRATPIEQGWAATSGPREVSLALELDRLAMVQQEHAVKLARAFKLAVGSLPSSVLTDGRALVFQDGAIVSGPTADEIANAQGYAETAAVAAAQIIPIEDDITTVAGIAPSVTTVAGIAADVTAVANMDEGDLAAVAGLYAKAEGDANRAESARDASIVNAQTYATISSGRAAVADNATFDVQGSADVAVYRYRRTSSTAQELIATFPSSAALADTKKKLHQAASVWAPVVFSFTRSNQYIKFDTGALATASGYGFGIITVTPGEVLQITQTTVGSNTALLVWYDAADAYIDYEERALSGSPQTYTDYLFIVPPNAVKLGVTTNGATPVIKRPTFDADLAQTVANSAAALETVVTTVAAVKDMASENWAAVSTFATITPTTPWTTGGFLSMADGQLKTTNTAYGYQFYTVVPHEPLLLSGGISGSTTALALWYDDADNYLGFSVPAPAGGSAVYSDRLVVVPPNAVKLGMTQHGGSLRTTSPVGAKRATRVLGMPARLAQVEADVTDLRAEAGYWAGKTVAWFGNSVPYGNSVTGANYPSRIAAALGFNLTVEATPGMSFRGGVRSNVTGGDAYGITGKSWTNVAWSMAMSLAEKQDLINNWQSKWRALLVNDPPATLSSSQQAQMLDTSYENRLIARHLGVNRKDLYIFDNPFNDRGMADDLETAGNDGSEDRLTYLGAMNFLIRLIKEDNPYAKIAIVGHYENQRPGRNGIAESQQMVADRWLLPILPLHKHLGWSQETIDVNGSWTAATGGYTWTAGTGVQTMTMLERVLPDNTHPAQDLDGHALDAIVDVITPWMRQLR